MKGDFSRDTFDPGRHYSRVLMQQGRVQLDADWNEQAAIMQHFLRALARDLIGPHGAIVTPGAALAANGEPVSTAFEIVAGMDAVRLADGSVPAADTALAKALGQALDDGRFVVNPGVYYVDGIRVDNPVPVAWPAAQEGEGGQAADGPFLVYLDVWERHVTWLQDPRIREVALGGPDTATRAQIVWQVRLRRPERGKAASCADVAALRPQSPGRLRARARRDAPQSSPCVIAPGSSYRGAENQLYRVEIHDGSDSAGGATFKWSRENGSVVLPVTGFTADSASRTLEVQVATLGRDDTLGVQEGDWLELVDGADDGDGNAGPLLRVAKVDRDAMALTLQGTTILPGDSDMLLLRRWDQNAGVDGNGVLAVRTYDDNAAGVEDAHWIDLEDGVQVWFASGGEFRHGDYWLIPARVATGDVEWAQAPAEPAPVHPAALQSPAGPRHHYAPLAVVDADGNPPIHDCRCLVARITRCPAAAPGRDAVGGARAEPAPPPKPAKPAKPAKPVKAAAKRAPRKKPR